MKYLGVLVLPLLAACVAETEVPDGALLFAENCVACHGADAKGGGPAAAGLDVPPPDLTMIAERNGGVFSRNQVASIIDGLDRGAHFSAAMPEFGAIDLGPLVMTDEDGSPVPIPADLLALTEYLEAIQRSAPAPEPL